MSKLPFKRFVLVVASLVLVTGVQFANPQPAAAACYYGAWLTSDLHDYKNYLHTRSLVRYRLGYTCGGSPTGEYEIDYRQMWIDIYDGGWQGYTRDWMAYHVYSGINNPAQYYDPAVTCVVAECHFYRAWWGNVTGSGSDPFVYSYCWSCTPTGFGNLVMEHHFRAGWIYAWYE